MRISPGVIASLLVSIASVSRAGAQSAEDTKRPIERSLTKFETSLIGKWYKFGDVNKLSYIASSGSTLFTINETHDALEISGNDNGSLLARSSKYRTSGVVRGNFILWANGLWWARYPVDFSPPSKPVANSDSGHEMLFDQRRIVRPRDTWALSAQAVDDVTTVLSASYGTDNKFSDVTGRVVALLRDDGEHYANPGELKADPNPGWNKALVIIYLLNGERRITAVVEGAPFSLRRLKAVR